MCGEQNKTFEFNYFDKRILVHYVLMEKSERRAVTGARINNHQKTGEDRSMCDMPAMLAASGRLGQKWLFDKSKQSRRQME